MQGLTKKDSSALKGVAILLMLFHHLFFETSRFDNYVVDFYPIEEDVAINIAVICKICVSIFAFITGYGLLSSIRNIELNRSNIIRWNISRLIKTISGFWYIYIIVFIVTMIINRLPLQVYFTGSTTAGFLYLLNDFLGLSNLLDTPTMCPTWWYMSAALLYILMVPLIYTISRKVGYLPIIMLMVSIPRILNIDYPGGVSPYVFIFPMLFGMIFADYDFFCVIENWKFQNIYLTYLIRFFIFLFLIVCVYYIQCSEYKLYVVWEFGYGIIPLIFICFFRFCIIRLPVISTFLRFLGTHSMTIFLTHTFIRYNYCESLVYGTFSNFLAIYAILLVLSVVLAVVLDGAKRICHYDVLVKKLLQSVSCIEDRLLS